MPTPPPDLTWARASSLGDLLLSTAAATPEAEAAIFPHERASYRDLADRAREFARGLIGLGIKPGERVGVMLPNGVNTITTIFGISLAGAVVVPINTRYRIVELSFLVRDAELSAIITSDESAAYADLPALLTDALPGLSSAEHPDALSLAGLPELRWVLSLGGAPSPGALGESDLRHAAAAVSDTELEQRRVGVRIRSTALVLYTSGTTSTPRGAVLSHEAIVRCWTEVARIFALTDADRVWAPCPMFHMGAVGPLLMCVGAGAAFVSDRWFEPGRALDLLAAEHPTILYPAYPPITQAVFTHERFRSVDLSSARAMLNVGPPDLLRQMQAALPQATQLSLYGLTEGGGAVTYNRLEDSLDVRVETCGHALPGSEVRIVDPDTRVPLDSETDGEIELRGVTLSDGYLNDPVKTATTFSAEGWMATGDHGRVDNTGRLVFLGRLKDMLKVGGENVAPAEIEEQLALHSAVKLVQVVGVPSAHLGEVPAAFVELRPGMEATAEELIEHCRGQIARFKLPHYVRFVTEWPLSATKIQKGPLRDQLTAELAADRLTTS